MANIMLRYRDEAANCSLPHGLHFGVRQSLPANPEWRRLSLKAPRSTLRLIASLKRLCAGSHFVFSFSAHKSGVQAGYAPMRTGGTSVLRRQPHCYAALIHDQVSEVRLGNAHRGTAPDLAPGCGSFLSTILVLLFVTLRHCASACGSGLDCIPYIRR